MGDGQHVPPAAEGLNSVIQSVKHRARGFRNSERLRAAIYFHLGGLDLYPEGIRDPEVAFH